MLFKSAVGDSERKSRLWIFGVRKSKIYYCSIVQKKFFQDFYVFAHVCLRNNQSTIVWTQNTEIIGAKVKISVKGKKALHYLLLKMY